MSFKTQIGALKKEKKYRGKLDNTELISVTLPPIDKFRHFQLVRRFFIESTIGFQVIFLLGLVMTSRHYDVFNYFHMHY
jgi:hypothetical protein